LPKRAYLSTLLALSFTITHPRVDDVALTTSWVRCVFLKCTLQARSIHTCSICASYCTRMGSPPTFPLLRLALYRGRRRGHFPDYWEADSLSPSRRNRRSTAIHPKHVDERLYQYWNSLAISTTKSRSSRQQCKGDVL